ncbi:hypothetical protein BDA96_10G137900 [Sorghum bicolor]|uniref:Uncharacterized protein n=1 Tax=Sorghum bicolor TaxID=4558 RepID=A0A921Q3S5_SORBI|nr:hypothetical protein BDA96_10G137900 [Sorghum bicolor]
MRARRSGKQSSRSPKERPRWEALPPAALLSALADRAPLRPRRPRSSAPPPATDPRRRRTPPAAVPNVFVNECSKIVLG